jgi:hypothetical protein
MTTGMLGADEGLVTEQDDADLVEMSLSMLRRWQREGTRPRCRVIGRQMPSGWAPRSTPRRQPFGQDQWRAMARQSRGALNDERWRP